MGLSDIDLNKLILNQSVALLFSFVWKLISNSPSSLHSFLLRSPKKRLHKKTASTSNCNCCQTPILGKINYSFSSVAEHNFNPFYIICQSIFCFSKKYVKRNLSTTPQHIKRTTYIVIQIISYRKKNYQKKVRSLEDFYAQQQ